VIGGPGTGNGVRGKDHGKEKNGTVTTFAQRNRIMELKGMNTEHLIWGYHGAGKVLGWKGMGGVPKYSKKRSVMETRVV